MKWMLVFFLKFFGKLDILFKAFGGRRFHMRRFFIIIGICYSISNSLFSQSHDMDFDDSTDSSRTVLIRIGGLTTGINKKEMGLTKVVFADNTAFLAERTKTGYYLMANANFQPTISEIGWIKDLKVAFLFLPIMDDEDDPKQLDIFYPLPSWLSVAGDIEFLELNQVTLSDCNLIDSGHLNFLVLNKVQFEDREKFLHELGKMFGLRYLVHDLIFTPSETEVLKNRMPEINVLLLSEYEAAIRSGTMELP